MNGEQIERVLSLIDANLKMNRDEVIRYILDHPKEVADQLSSRQQVDIPTSAGTVTIHTEDIYAA